MEFDQIRLATSVTNRILNAYDDIKARRRPETPVVAADQPLVPDPTMAGAGIEVRLEQPAMGEAGPAGEAAAEATLTGGVADTPLEGLLTAPPAEAG